MGTDLLSLEHSRGVVESSILSESYEPWPGSIDEFKVPKIEFMESRTGLRDINGDGFPDFADTTHGQPWRVWRGTGSGFEHQWIPWIAPVDWISRSDEGVASGCIQSLTPA
ncbi:MAG: hypothetical protein KC621_16220, partial [Myxococcales bacterium]|nr:hypothetical protein [Myxococcales bacterium]